jgi:hypothetical protein
MKVLMGFDDCGHPFAFDISTAQHESKILRSICKKANNHFNDEERKSLETSFEHEDFQMIYMILNHHDILHWNQRGCPSIVEVEDWDIKTAMMLGIMEL